MTGFEFTGLARIASFILSQAERSDLDRAELCEAAGIDEADLRDPDTRIPADTTWRLQDTAALLGVSGRTLQRRLREEGTSFTNTLDDLRHRSATRLLRDRSLSVTHVATRLGYSEPSTFYRAFRRWRGLSPDEFRRSE